MTDDVELLPLPEYFRRDLSHMTWEGLSQAAIDYAHANVEHAIASLQAEIEALRAEVERLKALVRSVGYETLDRAEQAEARAERLAEALRRYGVHDQACVAANIPICTCGLDAALEQEAGRG